MRFFLICALFAFSFTTAHAQSGQRSASGQLLARAAAKGYTFEIADVEILHDPAFASPATTRVAFSLKEIKLNGRPIVIRDDPTSRDRLSHLGAQFGLVCINLFDLSDLNLPDVRIEWKDYGYDANGELRSLTCRVALPAR